ncbi:aspartate/glutamate racemase family protein, partial [Paracoccus liaowanqingii]
MILLANPNSTTATTRAMCAILAPVLPHLRGWTAPEGPGVIETPAQLDAAGRLVAALTPPPGCRGVIVAAFGDPG